MPGRSPPSTAKRSNVFVSPPPLLPSPNFLSPARPPPSDVSGLMIQQITQSTSNTITDDMAQIIGGVAKVYVGQVMSIGSSGPPLPLSFLARLSGHRSDRQA